LRGLAVRKRGLDQQRERERERERERDEDALEVTQRLYEKALETAPSYTACLLHLAHFMQGLMDDEPAAKKLYLRSVQVADEKVKRVEMQQQVCSMCLINTSVTTTMAESSANPTNQPRVSFPAFLQKNCTTGPPVLPNSHS
jgi:hypothetical protein